jgi:AcrR family transcriptional regulator
MEIKLSFRVNPKLYLKDPESSELGGQILAKSIDMIHQIGFEHFTFKKLATEIQTTEATVYRYFENKHKLLLYALNWYWGYLEFYLEYRISPMADPAGKIREVIRVLTGEVGFDLVKAPFDLKVLNAIVISESSKVYLLKEVSEINKVQLYKPYKDLCAMISSIVTEYNGQYPFPKSLASTLVETAHTQQYFAQNLKGLTNVQDQIPEVYTRAFLENMVFSILNPQTGSSI